ncbi:hypothetical protein A3D88_04625 [Candidatus Peribacteria bacterium RIFCSPHIGHO2_02_FULL_52_16]|nr:MAG: hypothetical protein A2706_03255 [Candidatus Peribacteria bacterium RIFCSPHIGHO2_01_FULL_51_35]OGJ60889.1 MAG: hypothetical protein A3D88_04625 [Candidatus Peribacteria bacterium RIFCSPHIGHO2_02_FULL_52_16]
MRRIATFLLPVLLLSCVPRTQEPGHPITIFEKGVSSVPTAGAGTGAALEQPADLQTREVAYGLSGGKTLSGYLVIPAGDGPFPGLILIHEWWGLNDNIRANALAFARQGYAALAVDLYEGESTRDPARAKELAGAVQGNMDRAFDNLQQAVDFLRSEPNVNRQLIGSVGWCFGGGWSYQMAKNDLGVRATVMYYGRFSHEDDLSHMKSTILGHFGEKDASILVDDVKAFRVKLKTLSGDHEIYIYPNAGHGFANSDNPVFDPAAADVSWGRTLEFLQQTLGE